MANIPVQLDVMIPLPQISYAIAMWKFEQAIAAHAVAASPDLVPASQPLHSSTANLFSALNSSALNQPSQALSFAFLVGCNKLRLTLNGQHEALHAMLSYLFSEKDNNIGVGSYASYSAADWSFAWESRNGFTKLEMWFPKRGLTDAEVNMAIMATLQPLNLPPVNDDEPMAEISMQHIRDRAYVTAVPAMDLTQENAANCCIAFIKFARALRESHAPHGNFADAINRHHHAQVQRAVDLGVRAFGLTGVASTMHANPSATQSSRAVAASSQAPSQSMSHASILSTQRTGGF